MWMATLNFTVLTLLECKYYDEVHTVSSGVATSPATPAQQDKTFLKNERTPFHLKL